MARNPTASARSAKPPSLRTEKGEKSEKSEKGSEKAEGSDAMAELVARGRANVDGGAVMRSDPLQDSTAARALCDALASHKTELRRRGLFATHTTAALELADRIERLLQGVAGAALDARGRSPEDAEMLADAAQSAHAVLEAVARVTRGPKGRAAARAFGLGEAFNARRPAHVLRALQRIIEASESHTEVASDIGMLEEDRTTLRELAKELARAPGATAKSDESESLHEAHAALRAFFDLVAAKSMLGMSGDPDERARILAMIPRATDRRHLRRAS
jgi:hypothetical protein